jgi:hypothetical protein
MQPQPKLNKVEVLQIVRQIILEMQAMRRVLERSEERADGVRQYLRALERSLAAECQAVLPGLVFLPPGTVTFSRKRVGESREDLEILAELGVEMLDFQWLSDGSAHVQVNGGKAFKLSETLAHLLKILAQDEGPCFAHAVAELSLGAT